MNKAAQEDAVIWEHSLRKTMQMSPAAAEDADEDVVVICEHFLRKTMQAQLAKHRRQTTTEQQPSIFKVPKNIRDTAGDSKAYEPQIISLGPYHRGKLHLKPMEDNLKWHYLNQFLANQESSNTLKDCLTKIRDMERLARSHYALQSEELRKISSKDFVKMMVLDGCFVVEVLLTYTKNDVHHNYNKEADPIGSAIWILPLVAFDMMLLENQLPFCILHALFDVNYSCATKGVSTELTPNSTQQKLSELVLDFYSHFLPEDCKSKVKELDNVNHVLHLLHSCMVPTPRKKLTRDTSPSQPENEKYPVLAMKVTWTPGDTPQSTQPENVKSDPKNKNFLRSQEGSARTGSWTSRDTSPSSQPENLKSEPKRRVRRSTMAWPSGTSRDTPQSQSENVESEPKDENFLCRQEVRSAAKAPWTSRDTSPSQSENVKFDAEDENFLCSPEARPWTQSRTSRDPSPSQSENVEFDPDGVEARPWTQSRTSRDPFPSHPEKAKTPRTIPSATELNEAGVDFEVKTGNVLSFLDVTFDKGKGKMEIPHIFVEDGTCCFFRNLIAFEQCYSEATHTDVTAYAHFMDCLINTPADAALLKQNGIITSCLGNDSDIADLFNKLCKEVTIDYDACYLSGLFKDVDSHCKTKWNKWRASLKHKYFSNPWASIALVAASFLFVFTIIQTVFSVVSYVWPPK